MAATRPQGPGASLRALGRTLVDILRTRLELMAVESAQLQHRVARLASLAAAGFLALAVSLQLLAGLAVASFWDTPYRLQAIGGLALLLALVAGGCLLAILRAMHSSPPAMDATLRSLAADLEALG
jgi:uncharacterized membrane protein YqjE